MKSIVCVNTTIPSVDHSITYFSGESLRDYDIAVFDPKFPRFNRIEYSGGGSCISIEGSVSLGKAISHWLSELRGALQAGKTVFIILNEYEEDHAATGSTMASKTQRSYTTSTVNNYRAIPANLKLINAKGRKVKVKDGNYRGMYESIKNIIQYQVIVDIDTTNKPNVQEITKAIYTAGDGATIGAVVTCEHWSGSMVLLPYFDFDTDDFTVLNNGEYEWTGEAIKASSALVGQFVSIDKLLRGSTEQSPAPNWVEEIETPNIVVAFDQAISDIDDQITMLRERRSNQVKSKMDIVQYSHLLYENGNNLEQAIEKALKLLGYAVENLRIGDLEIDHVVVGPSGKRMIGESEGKDTSAIDITKFRQLESNIGEDFERCEINEPAKGLLFGNGFRLTVPEERAEQFTQKSLTNAKRLGSALIRTADLYPVAIHLLEHPEDEGFKAACRHVIEETTGGIVEFPTPQDQLGKMS